MTEQTNPTPAQAAFLSIRARLAASVGGEGTLAGFYSARTMRDTNDRARRELDSAAVTACDLLERVAKALEREGLAEHRQGDDSALLARFVRFWAAWQHAGSRVANWMVTGPAKFPVHSNNKKIATEDRRYSELSEFVKQAPAREVRRAKANKRRQLGAGGLANAELHDLEQRLAGREHKQELMRAVNAIIRKHKLTEEGEGPATLARVLAEQGHPFTERTAAALLVKPAYGPRGFMAWQLSNNNAEIHRLRDRVAQVRAKLERMEQAEAQPAPVIEVAGVEVVENVAEDRLQLIFPGKPSDATRAVLKGRGFRWSPRNGAWQRQLTANARYALGGVLEHLRSAT